MAIKDIDTWLSNFERLMQIGEPIEKAFPRLKSHSFDRDFSEPALALKYLVNWLWLRQQGNYGQAETMEIVSLVMDRAMEVYGQVNGQFQRGIYDLLSLSIAIITGDVKRMKQMVQIVAYAEHSSPPVIYASIAGILKARLVGDKSRELEQLDLRLSCSGKGTVYRTAKRNAYKAFVSGNEKLLIKHSRQVCAEFWTALERMSFPDKFDRHTEIKLGAWPTTAFWPWPELVLLKLCSQSEAAMQIDSFWLPASLFRSEVCNLKFEKKPKAPGP